MIWRFDGDMMKSLEMKISEIWNFNQLKLNFCTFWSFVKFSRQFYSIPCWFSFKLIDLTTILKINCNADPLIAISHCSSFLKEYFFLFLVDFLSISVLQSYACWEIRLIEAPHRYTIIQKWNINLRWKIFINP